MKQKFIERSISNHERIKDSLFYINAKNEECEKIRDIYHFLIHETLIEREYKEIKVEKNLNYYEKYYYGYG